MDVRGERDMDRGFDYPLGAVETAEYLIGRQLGKGAIFHDSLPVLRAVLCAAAEDPNGETPEYLERRSSLSDLYCIARMFKTSNFFSPVAIFYGGIGHSENIMLMLRAMFSDSKRFCIREVSHNSNGQRHARPLPWLDMMRDI